MFIIVDLKEDKCLIVEINIAIEKIETLDILSQPSPTSTHHHAMIGDGSDIPPHFKAKIINFIVEMVVWSAGEGRRH